MREEGLTILKVDLNCDLGESFGLYTLGSDEEIVPFVSSVNVACGFHASDPITMERTVLMAEKHGAAIGAHPGLPDLQGFGRRKMEVTPDEVKALVTYQVGALTGFTKNGSLHHVKPHGALYNMSAVDFDLALAVCQGIQKVNSELILYGLAGSQLIRAARKCGVAYAQEVFADRNIEADGTLVNRTKENALITDEKQAVDRVIQMIKTKQVESLTGEIVPIQPDTICLHGDHANAVLFLKTIRKALAKNEIEVKTI